MKRLVTALIAAVLAGCTAPPQTAVTVLAAASLAEAFGTIASSDVAYSFAGSQQLVAQVEAGAPADVVATADAEAMDRLVRAGLVDGPTDFARNRRAIAVAPGNPRRITGLRDLAGAGLRVVLADPAVPAGRYAEEVLARAGVRVRPVSLELDVKAVARKVESGEADAALVYATDVTPPSRVEIPNAANVVATYPVAVVRATANREDAQAFVDRLLGPAGRQALADRGFLLP